MRSIERTVRAVSAPIDDLMTFRPFPSGQLEHLDPFLFLNHHGPQKYGKNNRGLPFGPHPHRGFETLTFILTGDLVHWDSSGSKSVVGAGGVQWMTAGSGLIHSETSSEAFKKEGGEVEILQLWMNLPAEKKMVAPSYQGFSREELPELKMDQGKIRLQVISGAIEDVRGPAESITDLTMAVMHFDEKSEARLSIPVSHEILCYVASGEFTINDHPARTHDLVLFENDDEEILISASGVGTIIFGHGRPLQEPFVAYGPFVMNTEEEIQQAYEDYQAGRMGTWKN